VFHATLWSVIRWCSSFIQNFLVRILITQCFMQISEQFKCEVMPDNEHTFCSWIHCVRTCTTFEQMAWSSCLATKVTLLECHRRSWETFLYTGDLLLISFLYHSTWQLLGCFLNGTPCIMFMYYTFKHTHTRTKEILMFCLNTYDKEVIYYSMYIIILNGYQATKPILCQNNYENLSLYIYDFHFKCLI
jgi:hypothetical protein